MAAKHGFTIIYDPPEDGLWGALEASGNMSGLIGQAAYNEVDMVLSGVMTTRDRWPMSSQYNNGWTCFSWIRYNVADSPIAFDSDYMVFVSPPPQEKSKAVAPYMPFNAFVKNFNKIKGIIYFHKS